jgi:hypothetical protein
MVWNDWRYRWASLTGGTVADLTVAKPVPVPVPAVAPTAPVLVPADDRVPAALTGMPAIAASRHTPLGQWPPAGRPTPQRRNPADRR